MAPYVVPRHVLSLLKIRLAKLFFFGFGALGQLVLALGDTLAALEHPLFPGRTARKLEPGFAARTWQTTMR